MRSGEGAAARCTSACRGAGRESTRDGPLVAHDIQRVGNGTRRTGQNRAGPGPEPPRRPDPPAPELDISRADHDVRSFPDIHKSVAGRNPCHTLPRSKPHEPASRRRAASLSVPAAGLARPHHCARRHSRRSPRRPGRRCCHCSWRWPGRSWRFSSHTVCLLWFASPPRRISASLISQPRLQIRAGSRLALYAVMACRRPSLPGCRVSPTWPLPRPRAGCWPGLVPVAGCHQPQRSSRGTPWGLLRLSRRSASARWCRFRFPAWPAQADGRDSRAFCLQ